MIQNPGILVTIFAFMLVLGPLVFLHELGHYLAGRWFGVKAEEFSIGFGREVAGFTDRRGTRWKFGWLPLGGYVRFAGDMNPASQPSPEWLSLPAQQRAQTFQAKPLWQRAIIVAAGPIMNFLVAIAILGAFAVAFGQNVTPPVVGRIDPAGAAAHAGLQAGDRIATLDGRRIDDFRDLQLFTALRAGETVTIAFVRDGQERSVAATIGTLKEKDRFGNISTRGVLGFYGVRPVMQPVALWEAPVVGLTQTIDIVRTTVEGLKRIILGRIPVSELGGPLKIAQVSGQSLAMGPLELVYLIALISINLGFINLLPVPVLDGGHLLFYAVEAVRRRPVEPQVMEWAYRGGLVAILALMLFVTFNDLGAFGVWRSLAGLIG
ncbi:MULTISPECIES: RIP metalloprotease [Sphingomonas]|uniref:Regulator of sigma E protease n=1 Tax=Sphingomonas leidyi TaxID=68569 RepID=A0A7X5ZVU6_9SPHN|nr:MULTISPECIES: M50 family metallopeptidase [Sphingomonas]MBN8813015.1 site-2 protease family protein [Sphingomonas sp.]NIJ64768.1 regulator of sigma E protease [Sphingomonas leidyi]OJY54253.1 MAG: RIP metalloprotease RseP [Sphingomonas sp. 67-41]